MYLEEVRKIVGEVLGLGPRTAALQEDSALLGSLPELDSMGVVQLIAALENHFGLTVNDDEIGADTFATLGTLARFVERKLT
jgi:acyl carrier protein